MSKLSNILTVTYLLLAGGAMFLIVAFSPPGEMAYLSVYGVMVIWLLTLPWSLILVLIAWALFHDAQNPVFLLFFASCVVANVYLLRKSFGGSRNTSAYE